MKRLTSVLLSVLLLAGVAAAQYTQIVATHIGNGKGQLLTSGQLKMQPVDTTGNPISFVMGGGGATSSSPVYCTITSGALPNNCQFADTSLTDPVNLCVAFTIKDFATNQTIIGPQGYTCVQPRGVSFNLDTFVQKVTAGMVQPGTVIVRSTTTLPPTSAATVTQTGGPLAAILDFGIPTGIAVIGYGGGVWHSGTTYTSGAVVSYTSSGGSTYAYVSLAPNNIGYEPDTSPLWWGLLTNLANLPVALAAQSQSGPQPAWFKQLNGIPFVDGVNFPYSASGIVAACQSLPTQQIGSVSVEYVGRIIIGPGDVTLTGSGLVVPPGCQPVIHGTRFLFSGTPGQAGITLPNANPYPSGLSGWGTFKAITSGVDAFRINGGTGWRLGDEASHFEVLGPFRDIITVAPSQSGEWSQNGSTAGIYVGADENNACMTGDLVRFDTGNFADGGWMNNLRFNIRSDCAVASPASGRTGGVHFINSNTVQATAIDRHDIRFVNSVIPMANTTYPAFYFEKTGTATASITLSTDGGEIDTPPGGRAWFDAASSAAAAELLDVRLHRTGGTSGSAGLFGSTLVSGSGGNLEACGANNSPYSCEHYNPATNYLMVHSGGNYSAIAGSGAGNPGGLTWISTTGFFDFYNPAVPGPKLRFSYGIDPWGYRLGIGNGGAGGSNPIALHTDAPSGSLLLGIDGSLGALAPGKGIVLKSADGNTCLRLYVANGATTLSAAGIGCSEIQ